MSTLNKAPGLKCHMTGNFRENLNPDYGKKNVTTLFFFFFFCEFGEFVETFFW